MRIAIDIDSTLHHYWPLLSAAAKRRFGIELPYDRQFTGPSAACARSSSGSASTDTHSDEAILVGRALPARGRDRQPLARRRALHPHHEPPRRALPPGDEGVARRASAWSTTSSTAPTTRSAAAARSASTSSSTTAPSTSCAPSRRGSRPRRSATRGTTTSARRRTSSARGDWPELAGARAAARRRPPRGMSADGAQSEPRAGRAARDPHERRHDRPRRARRADDELRALLPAVEPERTLDDWGRSERVEGLFDRTVADFLYRLWFRCEVEGVEHVPAHGGALVVSNHAGALPPDAAMIAKAIKEEHPRGRPLHITVEHFFKGYPGFSMLAAEDRLRARPPGQRPPPARRRAASSCSSSPRAARAPRSSTRTATACAASAAAGSSRRRCAPARRSSRSPSSAPRRPRRSSPTCPRCSG